MRKSRDIIQIIEKNPDQKYFFISLKNPFENIFRKYFFENSKKNLENPKYSKFAKISKFVQNLEILDFRDFPCFEILSLLFQWVSSVFSRFSVHTVPKTEKMPVPNFRHMLGGCL